jgi:hypothetical protein
MITLPALCAAPITDDVGARAFFAALFNANALFHPEDSPRDIVNVRTGEQSFSDADADILAARIDEIFAVVEDPCTIALEVSGAELAE